MIFRQIILENVGTYSGRQTLSFNTDDPDKPITLIGGNNGAGKTTLIELIQFVLYGTRSPAHKRIGKNYRRYLKGLVHRTQPNTSTTDISSVEMTFEVKERNAPTQFIVRRNINRKSTTKKETLTVTENGQAWEDAETTWPDWIEKHLPASLSHLFFFDAEQIEKLIGAESSGEFLRQAIHNLLGIDIVDQLCSDLKLIERRKQSSHIPVEEQGKATQLNLELTEAVKFKEETSQNLGSIRCKLDRALEIEKTEDHKFKAIGGEVHQKRTEIELKHSDLLANNIEASSRLQSLAEGPIPLFLANDSLTTLIEQISEDNSSTDQVIATDYLRTEFSHLVNELESRDISKAAIKAIDAFRKSRPWNLDAESNSAAHSIFASQLDFLIGLRDQVIPEELQELQSALGSIAKVDEDLRKVQRERDSIPAEDSIQEQLHRRDAAMRDVTALQERLASTEEHYQKANSRCEATERNLNNFLKETAKIQFEAEADHRIIRFSEKSRETLAIFRMKIIEQNLQRIETSIFRRFHSLTHKTKLAEHVKIDRKTYQVQLLKGNRVLDLQDLSAGESQLLATSILWGLADSSNREIPVVIDTPLGRLDGRHRDSLVKNYFPKASTQVVLLSTDEEIVGERLSHLKPAISKSYILIFDDDSESTSIREGYFDGVTVTA